MSKIEHLEAPISGRPSPSAFTDLPGHKNDAIALRRRAAGSSFFSAMRLLPARRREAMYALCAFCREVDYVADSEASRSQKQALLLKWRSEIAHLFRPTLLAVFAMTLLVCAAPSFAAASENPAQFIGTLGDQGLEVIRSAATPAQKLTYFRQMLRQDFDLPDISRFVLGTYWRVASQPQRQEFRSLIENHLLHFFGERLSQYGGESFSVTGSRTDPACIIVTSQIIRPQEAPIDVDWQLSLRDGRYKVSDVVVDGVSMALTQRSEVLAIIQRNGGQVAGLLATIRDGM